MSAFKLFIDLAVSFIIASMLYSILGIAVPLDMSSSTLMMDTVRLAGCFFVALRLWRRH